MWNSNIFKYNFWVLINLSYGQNIWSSNLVLKCCILLKRKISELKSIILPYSFDISKLIALLKRNSQLTLKNEEFLGSN